MIKISKRRILILTNQLLITCGISKHLLYFLQEMKMYPEYEFVIICSGGDAVDIYRPLVKEILLWPWMKYEERSFKGFVKSIFQLIFFQKNRRFDIIHAHTHYTANIAKIISYVFKFKVVQTVHSYMKPIGRLNHYPSEYFISVNEHIYNFLINQKKIPTKRIRLIRSGVSSKFATPKEINKKIKIISAGRLVAEKGFDVFITSVSKLDKNLRNKAEFIIAGKGESESELKELSKRLKANIQIIGEVKDFNTYLRTTDIFVLASQSEGFPLTIVEAALNKNLIISSNFLGHDSILKNNLNCLIFNIDDAQELSEKISYAIENYDKLKPMINNLYEVAIKEFDLNDMVNKTLKFYSEIIN